MITLNTHLGEARIVESTSELPDLTSCKILYRDVETLNSQQGGEGLNPWLGDRICGVAVTVDDAEGGWYVPVRHSDTRWNLPLENVQKWLRDQNAIPKWVNHNVVFDQGFLYQDDAEFPGELIDTLTMAKCYQSDRFQYGLKPLCREWLKLPMSQETEIKAWLQSTKKKKSDQSYGDIPADILGTYAVEDVLGNRELYKFILERLDASVVPIWNTEVKLTPVLWDMERDGLCVHRDELELEHKRSSLDCLKMEQELVLLTDQEYVDSADHIRDILVTQRGLPVLAYTKDKETGKSTERASFDRDALAMYSIHPRVTSDPEILRLVKLIGAYREEMHFKNLYLEPWMRFSEPDSRLHANYNQLVRTGRMSGRRPYMQQLNKRAKGLIHPDPGQAFGSWDASQIEFRLIVHYIKDPTAIMAYQSDAKTDFHQWVADLCRIKRKPAKTVNFAMAYGAGKRNIVSQLRQNADVMAEVSGLIQERIAEGELDPDLVDVEYQKLCRQRAEHIYHDYHDRLPGIKEMQERAKRSCIRRSYTFNAFGRRRHLPPKAARKAFNSSIQGGAMDYIKDRMVALSPRYCEWTRDLGLRLAANVHDELLWVGPLEAFEDPRVRERMERELSFQSVPFRVPFVWDCGLPSTGPWSVAGA